MRASYSVLLLLFLSTLIMADAIGGRSASAATATAEGGGGSAASVHIVYVEKPEGEEPEAYHVRTLASVLGSEEAAKEALIYHYKTAASGFSAKLTPDQVAEISKKPGVLQVVPSRTYQLHSA